MKTPTPEERGREMLKANGYGPDPASSDPGYVPRKGWRRGGKVAGKHAPKRMDRRARGGPVSRETDESEKRAGGGGVGHGHKGHKPAVTVNIKTGGSKPMGAPIGPPMMAPHPPMAPPPGAGAPMPGGPPRPPMGPPMAGGPPPGAGMPMAGPGMRPPMVARGGEIRRDHKGRFVGGAV